MKVNQEKKSLIALKTEIPVVLENEEGKLRGGFVAISNTDSPSPLKLQIICIRNTNCNVKCTGTTTGAPNTSTTNPGHTSTDNPYFTTPYWYWYGSMGASIF